MMKRRNCNISNPEVCHSAIDLEHTRFAHTIFALSNEKYCSNQNETPRIWFINRYVYALTLQKLKKLVLSRWFRRKDLLWRQEMKTHYLSRQNVQPQAFRAHQILKNLREAILYSTVRLVTMCCLAIRQPFQFLQKFIEHNAHNNLDL